MMSAAPSERTAIGDLPPGWRIMTVSDFAAKVGSGATPHGGKSVYLTQRASHALIRSQHVFDRYFDNVGLAFISEEHSRELRNAEVRSGDVLLNITGDGVTFARACIVPDEILPACVNQHVSIIRVNREVCEPGYLLSFLTHPLAKRYMESFNTGGSRRALTKGHIESFEVPLPPLPIQRRIAGILSAYDELIENSQRRIKILEAMARALYREWFVHFRFPGHESLPRVPSPLGEIPQGWEVSAFTELAEVLSGGTPKTDVAEYWNGEIPFFTPRDVPDCFYVQDTDKHATALGLSKCSSELYPPDTVFITARGTVGKVALPSVPMAMNQSCYALRGKSGIAQRFLFLMTLQQVDYLKTNVGGATFDTIIVDTFRRMEVVKPPRELVARFASKSDAVFDQVNTLQRQIQNLRRTRDLLLPRLLSGQIDVEATPQGGAS
jgi:type I restriction enzyme S subunit